MATSKSPQGSSALEVNTRPGDPLAEDLRKFLFALWLHLGLPNPTPVQYDIAKWLQYGPRRLVTMAFRGVGKSWITTAFVLWLLYRNPNIRVMVVSANSVKAAEFTTFALRLIQSWPILAHLVPRSDQRQSTISFDVALAPPDPSPSVKSVGITGQLTGSRADVIVPDDIEVPSNSDTQAKRERILELIKEFDAVLKPKGRVVYLGTPQSEASIYNTLPERGYVIRQWPALYPRDPDKWGGRLAPMIADAVKADQSLVGKTVDPARFTDEDLLERQLSYGRSGFALQFLMDTSLSDAEKYPLKLSDLIIHPCDPYRAPLDFAWASAPDLARTDLPALGLVGDRLYRPMWAHSEFAPYEGCVMAVDPSGRGRDETAYAVVKLLHGRMFLVASGGFLGGYTDATLDALLSIAKKHEAQRIIAEPNFGGGMFTKLLQGRAHNKYAVTIEDAKWANTSKEQRIVDILEPVLNQHRLIVCPSVIQADHDNIRDTDGERAPFYRLTYQMTRMVKAKGALAHDDRIDALALAVSFWLDHMAVDSEKAILDHQEAQFQLELDKFLEGALNMGSGRTDTKPAHSTTLAKSMKR